MSFSITDSIDIMKSICQVAVVFFQENAIRGEGTDRVKLSGAKYIYYDLATSIIKLVLIKHSCQRSILGPVFVLIYLSDDVQQYNAVLYADNTGSFSKSK